MPIKNKDISNNLKHNYGLVFKELLVRYNVQSKFYDKEIGIGKNRWKSACEGKTFLQNDDKLYELTKVDKSILKGTTKMQISTLVNSENEKEYIDELDNFIECYNDNSEKIEDRIKNGDYDTNFIKVFRYVISLTSKVSDGVEERFNNIIKQLNIITSNDYMNVDINLLEIYKETLEEHMNITSAAITVKKFKK